MVKISSIFVAFLENMNFNVCNLWYRKRIKIHMLFHKDFANIVIPLSRIRHRCLLPAPDSGNSEIFLTWFDLLAIDLLISIFRKARVNFMINNGAESSLKMYLSFYEFLDAQDIFQNFMSGSSHIWSVMIGAKYWNCCGTMDVYLLFAILLGQIQSKLNYRLVTYKLTSA